MSCISDNVDRMLADETTREIQRILGDSYDLREFFLETQRLVESQRLECERIEEADSKVEEGNKILQAIYNKRWGWCSIL